MTIAPNDRMPSIELVTAGPGGPEPVTTDAFFAGRRVALFAVPGAFTPTCSARHLPGFVERAPDLRAAGIDAVACTAVNDIFVLSAWLEAGGGTGIVIPLADGNASLAHALGLALDASAFGMGTRSQRYAMIVDDRVVKQLAVDAPGEFRASSADELLALVRRTGG